MVKKKKSRKKKSYNPFKMWGAWIGAIIVFIWANIQRQAMNTIYHNNFWLMFSFKKSCFSDMFPCIPHIITYLLFIGIATIIGFLIGWGIHSFVRKLK